MYIDVRRLYALFSLILQRKQIPCSCVPKNTQQGRDLKVIHKTTSIYKTTMHRMIKRFSTLLIYRVLACMILLLCMTPAIRAQKVAVKTNLLYDATTTPNIGAELQTGRHTSLQVIYGLNPWKSTDSERLMRHWVVNPEFRYWFCRPMMGHFVGVDALGGEYRVQGIHLPFGMFPSLKDNRYVGWYAGGGIAYGYAFPLSKHWNVEAAIGVGYVYTQYKKYECERCGALLGRDHKNYVGPTKAAINLVYVF